MKAQDEQMLQELEKELTGILKKDKDTSFETEDEDKDKNSLTVYIGAAVVAGLLFLALGGWLGHTFWPDKEGESTEKTTIVPPKSESGAPRPNCIILPENNNSSLICQIADLQRISGSSSLSVFLNDNTYEIQSADSTLSFLQVNTLYWGNTATEVTIEARLKSSNGDTTGEITRDTIQVTNPGESLLQVVAANLSAAEMAVNNIRLTYNGEVCDIDIPNTTYENSANRSLKNADYYFWVIQQVVRQVEDYNKDKSTPIDIRKIKF